MSLWDQFRGYFTDALEALANFFQFLGGHRWAAAIIALTLIVRTLLLPLAVKQIRSMREQQRLQPELQRLRQKYRDDRQKMTQETMELFRREGVNPYAACLPLIAQMPVFIGIYQALRKLTSLPPDLAMRVKAHKLDPTKALEFAQNRLHGIPKMPFLGLGDLAHPAISSIAGILLLALMTITQLVSTRQLNPGTTDQQRRLQMLMPFMFIFLFLRFPAAMVLYWATQSLYQLVQQWIMTRDTRQKGAGFKLSTLIPWRSSNGQRPGVPRKAQPVPAPVPAVSPAVLGDETSRRALAEKRRRRRKRKRKRRR